MIGPWSIRLAPSDYSPRLRFNRCRPNVGHPTFACAVRRPILRLTSERQLVECLHPAVVCLWLNCPKAKRLDAGQTRVQRGRVGVLQRYNTAVCGFRLELRSSSISIRLHSAGGSHCCLDLSSLSKTTLLIFNIALSLPPHANRALVERRCARSYVGPESLNLADYSKLDHLSGANGNYVQAARMLPLRHIQARTETLGADSRRRKVDSNSLFGEPLSILWTWLWREVCTSVRVNYLFHHILTCSALLWPLAGTP